MKRINVVLEERQVELLKELALLNGWSFSHVVRMTIDESWEGLERALRLSKRRKSVFGGE